MNKKTLKALEYNKIIKKLEEKAESELGKQKIRNLKIQNNKDKIISQIEETDEALTLLIKRGNPPLFGIKNIIRELKRTEIGGSLTPEGLLKVSDILRVARSLKAYIRENEGDKFSTYPIIEGMIDSLVVYKNIEDEINRAIINKNEISDNASGNLRNIRRQMTIKNESIKSKLSSIINSQTHKKYLQDTVITVRGGRYVVPVKKESKSNVPGMVHDISASGATVFIEPMAVVELNNELKEFEIEERKEIEKILFDLSQIVAEKSQEIRSNQDLLQDIDFVFAKGKLGLEMNATKPIINTEGYINIKKGRHPLLKEKKIVPTDVYIGKDFNSLIITGPNTGGKTVTLKTVGLFTLMVQSGLLIPAESNSSIAIFDNVFADIGDEQSIEQSLSTFSSHMSNIVDILENVEENSLILFDELGAGTDPTEGAALAMSILDYLLKLNARVIATTHYSQLKLYALTTEKVENASVEFDIDTLSPTYKLMIGVAGKSNAFEISRRLGLQDYIIDDAKDLIKKENIEFEDVLQTIEKDRRQTEENKLESEKFKLEIENLKEDLKKEQTKTQDMREKIIRKARQEAREILKDAKETSSLIIEELKDVSNEVGKERSKRIQQAREMLKTKTDDVDNSLTRDVLNVKAKKPPKNLKIGENVEILSLNQMGKVLTLPDDNGNLNVQVGIMKVNVNISTLRRTQAPEKENSKAKSRNIIQSKSKYIKSEIDLRGKNIQEAMMDIDKYLDDSYIAGLKEVYIIHGKGTGALKKGLMPYFKKHKLIKSYRPGAYGEGGAGVTVLEIK